ncbi:MAG: NAAT family transporter [Xanthomonadaceae bacterium]|nr:NAAT family transporter [Xanthomonadaceae bacterium]
MLEWTEYIKIFVAILVIVNPLGAVPFYISLTTNVAPADRRRIPNTTSLSIAVVLIASALVGEALLRFFGISIASFRVGGGILLMLMAISMMQARQSRSRQTPEEAMEAEEKDSIAVVPLAIPLLAGPGAISTMIIYASLSNHPMHYGMLMVSGILVAAAVWTALLSAERVARLLGRTGINIAMRLMGILLAAIAIEFIASGALDLLPGLQG